MKPALQRIAPQADIERALATCEKSGVGEILRVFRSSFSTDRLDLVDHVFDDKAVARLTAEGKLSGLPDGAAKVVDHHNLQVRPRKET